MDLERIPAGSFEEKAFNVGFLMDSRGGIDGNAGLLQPLVPLMHIFGYQGYQYIFGRRCITVALVYINDPDEGAAGDFVYPRKSLVVDRLQTKDIFKNRIC